MSDLIKDISSNLQKQIEDFSPEFELRDIGNVLSAGDGIARASGLADVQAQELVQFENGVMGIAFNLEKDNVGIIIMGEFSGIDEGMNVRATGRIASVPVGDGMVGRVVNALGEPIDGKGEISAEANYPVEKIAPGIIARKSVSVPVQTDGPMLSVYMISTTPRRACSQPSPDGQLTLTLQSDGLTPH